MYERPTEEEMKNARRLAQYYKLIHYFLFSASCFILHFLVSLTLRNPFNRALARDEVVVAIDGPFSYK